jgi:hypothetical protein
MSGKQSKRERRRQRAAGEVPALDAKRAERRRRVEEIETARIERERFRVEHPDEYAAQLAESRRRGAQAMRVFASALSSFL